jgi:alkanesulfonate monooxygenase SsuD/methylene tetrahydromethanopterin reductase-like flavin-dependent oxidoreductase (luciferase family)
MTGSSARTIAQTREGIACRFESELAAAGRKREDFQVNLYVYVAIAKDRRQAIDDARGTVAFYSSIAQYEKYYAAHGFGDAARAVASAASRNDVRGMIAAVPDEMVEAFAVTGTRDEALARVEELGRYADSITVIPPGTGNSLPPEKIALYRDAIAATLRAALRRSHGIFAIRRHEGSIEIDTAGRDLPASRTPAARRERSSQTIAWNAPDVVEGRG